MKRLLGALLLLLALTACDPSTSEFEVVASSADDTTAAPAPTSLPLVTRELAPSAQALSPQDTAERATTSRPTPQQQAATPTTEPTATATPSVPEGFTIALPTAVPTATPVPAPPTPTPGPTAVPAPTATPKPTTAPAPTSPPAPTAVPTTPPPTATPPPAPSGSGNAGLESQMLALVNDVRAQAGAPPLVMNSSLTQVARNWSTTLPASFQHNPNVSAQIPAGWSGWGENIAYNGSMEAAHQALVNSSGHYANMVNPNYNQVGIGIWVQGGLVYVTQVFASY